MEQPTTDAIINTAIGLREGAGYIDIIKLADSFGIDIYPDSKHAHSDEEFHACIIYDNVTKKY